MQENTLLVQRFTARYGIEAHKVFDTLKATVFKKANASDEQLLALLLVADQYKLNPFTKEIYAFPDKSGGIVPMIGIDGWIRMINEHPAFNGMSLAYATETVKMQGAYVEGPLWIECIIRRKDREHPIQVREYLKEMFSSSEAWRKSPYRMLRHKAIIQCARLAFGFSGIYDPDEAERIRAAREMDVTETAYITPDEEARLRTLLIESNTSEQAFKSYLQVQHLHEIRQDQLSDLCEKLNHKMHKLAPSVPIVVDQDHEINGEASPCITSEDEAHLRHLLTESHTDEQAFKDYLQVQHLREIRQDQLSDLCEKLGRKRRKLHTSEPIAA